MLCYVQASEELEYNWFAIRLGFIDFLSNWASWAPFEKLDDLVLGRVWSKKLDQAAEPGLLACLLAVWPPEWPPGGHF